MANAQVEKLKALGLRHGEKAAVGITSALCLLFLVTAITKPTLDLTPDEVSTHAKASRSNLARRQDPDDILKRFEEGWLKTPEFEKLVDAQSKDALVAANFKPARTWVTPEPGAGLIRDRPELVAPTELYAYPGRGGTMVFALNEEGKRIHDDEAGKIDPAIQKRRSGKRRRQRGGMMGGMPGYGGMGGYGGGMMGMGGGGPQDEEKAKKKFEEEQKRLKGLLAGKEGAAKEEAKEKDDSTPEGGPFKEEVRGLRWVSITGVIDHKKMLENYLTALKDPAVANPYYKQLDVERQVRKGDGTWSEWTTVDMEANHKISWQLPEEEEEMTPDNVRIDALVDPLPFLKAGLWEKVHVFRLVPKEKREAKKPETGGGMMGGMPGGMMSGMPGGGMPGGGMSAGMMGGGMPGAESAAGGGMPGGMMGGFGGGGGGDFTSFETTTEPTIMIRALDFTVEEANTYRFRIRVVVYNPNYNKENVSPGVDHTSLELKGPWSEPTDEVTMPADVTTFAMHKTPAAGNAKRTDEVDFQIARWNPKNGVTVTANDTFGIGAIVGQPLTREIPNSDGEKAKRELVDFNSRQLLLDTAGGPQPISQLGVTGAPLDMPVLALLLQPDGSVVLRNEAADATDPVRKDMDSNYKREVKESGKKRESSMGSMYGGMGGMGGMMGGR